VQAAQISGQLARRYNLPFRSSNVTTAHAVDAQAAYESEMALWGAITAHAHLVNHAAAGSAAVSPPHSRNSSWIAELLQMIAAWLAPPAVDEATLGLEAIAAVGHGGHFFGTAHTLERYERAFYHLAVLTGTITTTGRTAARLRLRLRCQSDLEAVVGEYQPPAIDPAVDEALRDYVARRKREIHGAAN
jgi:trimethylamine--corrinoid protein Co-methyltransferase